MELIIFIILSIRLATAIRTFIDYLVAELPAQIEKNRL